LPVPRSPMISTGFVSPATRETCSSIATNAGDSPIIGVVSEMGVDISQLRQYLINKTAV
jgi:hypothetical protein